jgi:hypothetical protein
MGDVIMFRPRAPKELDAETEALLQEFSDLYEREARRRFLVYGEGDSPELERILALYPMFRLTHAKRARRCVYCDSRIAPMELHFVLTGSYICQSGTCTQAAAFSPNKSQ